MATSKYFIVAAAALVVQPDVLFVSSGSSVVESAVAWFERSVPRSATPEESTPSALTRICSECASEMIDRTMWSTLGSSPSPCVKARSILTLSNGKRHR